MPEITLTSPALAALQQMLRDAGHTSPDEIPDVEELIDRGEIMDFEGYHHKVRREVALRNVLDACIVCGDIDCDRGTATIGPNLIHRDKHPEVRAERAMDEPRGIQPHDPDWTGCRECGVQFDLARQTYYDNLCPGCKAEVDS